MFFEKELTYLLIRSKSLNQLHKIFIGGRRIKEKIPQFDADNLEVQAYIVST